MRLDRDSGGAGDIFRIDSGELHCDSETLQHVSGRNRFGFLKSVRKKNDSLFPIHLFFSSLSFS